jgi:transposase
MQVLFPKSAGLDVHKKTVVAAYVTGQDNQGNFTFTTRTFGTMTGELLELGDWLNEAGITHVAMESTGEYWKPVYNIMEDQFALLVVNAHHVKHVPGRKTDYNDAQWLAQLMTYGLLKASFIPPEGQRELREMTRARATMVKERTALVNRLQKTLESANIKLASVVTDVQGVSARAILKALVQGTVSPEQMAEMAKGRLRSKLSELERALEGRVKAHHRFILTELLGQIDSLEESIARFDAEIEAMCVPFEKAVTHLDTIPGVGKAAAQQIVSEIGTELDHFPTSGHLCAWAGVAPGNHQSGGKTLSSRTRQGNRNLKKVLIEAAQAAVHVKDCYLSAQYHRLVGRRGKKRAIVAVAHSILTIAYHLISRDEDYQDLGGNYFDQRHPLKTVQTLMNRLGQLGYDVQLSPKAEPRPADLTPAFSG